MANSNAAVVTKKRCVQFLIKRALVLKLQVVYSALRYKFVIKYNTTQPGNWLPGLVKGIFKDETIKFLIWIKQDTYTELTGPVLPAVFRSFYGRLIHPGIFLQLSAEESTAGLCRKMSYGGLRMGCCWVKGCPHKSS
jgi:hypothetical protein